MTAQEKNFVTKCGEYLSARWEHISLAMGKGTFKDPLLPGNEKLVERISACIDSSIKTYHYVLPTQILCKCVDPKLDCHSLQTAYNKPGAFDARTVAHEVIVPFDQANHRVMGGSSEPYVNNPLRCPAVIKRYAKQQKNKVDWGNLIEVLDAVEESDSETFTKQVFDQILALIYRQLSEAQVVYPVPNRISLHQTLELISTYTADKSGGDRVEAVCTALFKTVAVAFGIFDEIRRQKVNASDVSSGMGADIECYYKKKLALLVEVKDRSLTLTQLDTKLDGARVKKISEILFLAEKGVEPSDKEQVNGRIKNEFISGQNIYVSNFLEFSTGILALLGEKGRVLFLSHIGGELDNACSDIIHRKAWAQLLKTI
ncbi:MAG: restriction endonuclease, SacI family [Desulfocucumaceae bacterium]